MGSTIPPRLGDRGRSKQMTSQITHQPDENGILRQTVSPDELRKILDEAGDDYSRPAGFGPDDEWNVV